KAGHIGHRIAQTDGLQLFEFLAAHHRRARRHALYGRRRAGGGDDDGFGFDLNGSVVLRVDSRNEEKRSADKPARCDANHNFKVCRRWFGTGGEHGSDFMMVRRTKIDQDQDSCWPPDQDRAQGVNGFTKARKQVMKRNISSKAAAVVVASLMLGVTGNATAEERPHRDLPPASMQYQGGGSPMAGEEMHHNINPKAPPMTKAEFDKGRQMYFERCAGCHGVLRK